MGEERKTDAEAAETPKKKARGKIWLIAAGLVLAVLALALLAHPLWVGAAGRGAVGALAPSYTGTDVVLEGLGVNGYAGTLAARGFRLGNPKGGPAALPDAVSVQALAVDVAPLSLLSSVLRVRDVTVASPHASVFCIEGVNNFAAIGENVQKKLGKKEKKDEKASETRVDVEHLLVTDVRVDLGTVSALTIPRIELTTVTNVATLVVENVRLSNPAEETAVTNALFVGRLAVTLDWPSVFTKKIHIYDITVEDPYVSAYFGKLTSFDSFNLLRVFSQVVPGKDAEKKADAEKADEKGEKVAKRPEDDVKIVIDRIALVRVGCRLLGTECGPLIKERIEIRDIGKSADGEATGAAAEDVLQEEVWPRLKKEMGAKFEAVWDAFSKTYDMLANGAGGVLSKAFGEAPGKALGGAVKGTGEVVGKTVGVVEDGAKATVNAVEDGAKAAVETLGSGAKNAVDAVGDGAKALGGQIRKLNPFAK